MIRKATEQIGLTLSELKADPSRYFDYERAIETIQNERAHYDCPWIEEILASFRAIIDLVGLKQRRDGEPYFPDSNVAELCGPRAMAWAENNVFGPLRLSFRGKNRWALAKYGRFYRPGMVKPCPLTGICFDEDFLDCFRKIGKRDSLADCASDLSTTFDRLVEAERDHYLSEDEILETEGDRVFWFDE